METFNKLIGLISEIDTSLFSVNFRVVKKKNNGPTIITLYVVSNKIEPNCNPPSICITRSLKNFENELDDIIKRVEDLIEASNMLRYHIGEEKKWKQKLK